LQNISSVVALNYVSLSFDISRKNGVWTKTAPIMERSGSSSEIHVHCRTVWFVVNCWIRGNNLCCRFCKIFCLSELLCQALMYLRVSIYPQKNPGTHHIKYQFCSMRLNFAVSQYVLCTLVDSNYSLYRMLLP
jgi:predicted DNA-binding protein (MmcQ/YjbR family)